MDPNPIWVQDGTIYTSSGFSAGFLRRSAGQTQLSVTLAAQASEMRPIQELQVWIADNLRRDLSTPVLAELVSMSVRNFVRVFTADVGTTPAKYVLHLRVEAALRLLESTPSDFKQISVTVGFGNADVMRRAFARVLRTSPSALREGRCNARI